MTDEELKVFCRDMRAGLERLSTAVDGALRNIELMQTQLYLLFPFLHSEPGETYTRANRGTVLSPQPQAVDLMKGTAPILCGVCGRAADSPVRERCQAHAGEL